MAESCPQAIPPNTPLKAILFTSHSAKTGYAFVGWYENGTLFAEIATGSYGDRVFEAKWSAIVYSITYNLNGGAFEVTPKTLYTIETKHSR